MDQCCFIFAKTEYSSEYKYLCTFLYFVSITLNLFIFSFNPQDIFLLILLCSQGSPGPPGEDGPQGKDGHKVNIVTSITFVLLLQ